jgi:hypothetical protein
MAVIEDVLNNGLQKSCCCFTKSIDFAKSSLTTERIYPPSFVKEGVRGSLEGKEWTK